MNRQLPKPSYLIDGYNVLFRLAKGRAAFKAKRLELIENLNDIAASLSLNLTVIFDSAHPYPGHPSLSHFDALEIVYTTQGLSADAFILEKVHSAKHPEHFTVVTNDKTLTASCKYLKAKTLSIDAFLAYLSKKQKVKRKTTKSSVRPFRDSDPEIARLLSIFEKRLFENLND